MQTVELNATPRTGHGKGPARQLRAKGFIPSVSYGGNTDTHAIAIQAQSLRDILLSPRGRNTIIELKIEGVGNYPVMVKEYTVHPLSRKLLHADFIRVEEGKPIVVEVPFNTVGKSRGEIEGGTLLTTLRKLPVRCIPKMIPDSIEHDVSALAIDDFVRVKELTLPEGIEVLLPPERRVVVVEPPRVPEVTEVAAEGAEGVEGAEGAPAAEGADDAAKEKGGDDKDKKDKK